MRENDVIMKYKFYQDEILWLTDKFQKNIERDAKGSGILILVKLYEVNGIRFLCRKLLTETTKIRFTV